MTAVQSFRSDWNHAIVSEGLRLGFHGNGQNFVGQLPSLVPGSIATEFADLDFVYSLALESSQSSYSAHAGSRVLVRCVSFETALKSIVSKLQNTIAKYSRQHLFLHAGVIGWRGRAILFPGRTYSGKSTLVRALMRAGAVYFSDEFARVDAHGLIHPFARPLFIRCSEGKAMVRPEEERAEIASAPAPLGAIIATRYKQDALWQPERLSNGQALLVLLRNTVAVRLDPAKAMRTMGALVSSATAIRSLRGDAETGASAVLRTLDNLMN